MKYYCQLLNLTSGYVEGSAPPQYRDELKQAKEMLGSDSVMVLDGRLSLPRMIEECKAHKKRIGNIKTVVGFRIVNSDRFVNTDEDTSKTLYQQIGNFKWLRNRLL